MGNNGSRSGNVAQRHPIEPEQQWAHSFPRNPHRVYQHKVLPENEIGTKLRCTNNGEILQSGGTISGRHHQQTLSLEREDKSFRIFRASSITSNSPDEYNHREEKTPNRSYVSRHRGVHKYAAKRYENNNNNNVQRERMKTFGSEPDLRNPTVANHQNVVDKYKGKRKYKAPPPPNTLTQDKSNLNSCKWDEEANELSESRKVRLYKTNAELKKKNSSPIKIKQPLSHENSLDYRIDSRRSESRRDMDFGDLSDVQLREQNKNSSKYVNNRFSLPEIEIANVVPEFQVELKQAIKNLKYSITEKNLNEKEKNTKEKLKTLDHNLINRDIIKNKLKQIEPEIVEKETVFDIFNTDRGQPSGKESTPEKSPSHQIEMERKDQPSKLFYFGMNEDATDTPMYQPNYPDNDEIDHFAAKLHSYKFPLQNSSGSDLSSEFEMDESQLSSSGIALQLRPILPKKQLEIPRFSPAAAWKLLSAAEPNFITKTETSDEVPTFLEERIEKLSRDPAPPSIQIAPRSSTNDKSGDSGISGDAGPACFDDSPDPEVRTNLQLPHILSRSGGISWTPQQDLGEEESSTDEELINNQLHSSNTHATFIPNQNVFSLSLPRDSYLSSYVNNKHVQSYLGLQKIKRSMSGVLGNIANKRDSLQSNTIKNENWFLSKSAPNSLNNGLNSLELQKAQDLQDSEKSASLVKNRVNTQNVSRIMYLPELDKLYIKNQAIQKKQERNKGKDTFRKSRSAERSKENYKFSLMTSKSYENISANQDSSSEPEDLQDPPKQPELKFRTPKSKRFTFQSTIRQIERRRLAERLSREAEKKEKQRLCELQAMQRVEEEFQRKRAREKASIRQQLRLFSLDETTWSSLPPQLENKNEVPVRSDPEGAVSSKNSSPILISSEYKNMKYKCENLMSISRGKNSPISDSSDDSTKKAPMTQILSEYRQQQRDYKDFRGSPRYKGKFSDSQFFRQVTTIHPQITCDMPKASTHKTDSESSANYRKQFAHGVKTNNYEDGACSDDSQSNFKNYSPKIYNNKHKPISRF